MPEKKLEGGLRTLGYIRKTSPSEPLITVLTVVLNGDKHLEKTILSVINQDYCNIEYIIIDGGSVDGTIETIKTYEDQIDYWVSEKDKGIYDAMNKGLDCANGDFIININIGDLLLDVPFNEIKSAIRLDADVVAFSVKLNESTIFKPKKGFTSRIDNSLHHQGTFYSRKLLERYDLTYKIFADFDLNQRLINKRRKVILHEKIVSSHAIDGISHTKEHFGEVWQIIRKNQGGIYVLISYFYFRLRGLWNRLKKLSTLY